MPDVIPFADSEPVLPKSAVIAGALNFDCPCRRCGYNLRGLATTGRCPECNSPVGLSAHGDLLRFADPDWLRVLARGLSLVLWGVLATMVFGFGARFLSGVGFPREVTASITLIGSAIYAYGGYLFTQPDPSGLSEGAYVNQRKLVRIGLTLGLLSSVLAFLTRSLLRGSGTTSLVLAGLVSLMQLLSYVGEWVRLRYMRTLALRIPDNDLAKRAEFLSWAFPATQGLFIACGLAIAILAAISSRNRSGMLDGFGVMIGCGAGFCGLLMVILFIRWVRLQHHLKGMLAEEADEADRVWSRAEAFNQ